MILGIFVIIARNPIIAVLYLILCWMIRNSFFRSKLSNYGNLHSIESDMDNRVAKSACLSLIPYKSSFYIKDKITAVKVQRVDGSSQVDRASCLRCTLTGFVRNYQIKILSKQINRIRFYSTTVNNTQELNMNPWFVTGFSDGESCFMVKIKKNKNYLTGYHVIAEFIINLHKKDRALLELIQKFFGVGKIYNNGAQGIEYRVHSVKDMALIINHFDKFPLITKKHADYLLFKMAVDLIKNKEHLTSEGLRKLVALKANINWGLSADLKAIFLDVIPYPRPDVSDFKINNSHWLAGFASAEGCFFILIKSKENSRETVQLMFKLSQHSRDEQLMKSIIDFLGCGNVYVSGTTVEYIVTKFNDLTDKVIPFFQKYPIQGVKHLDFLDFVSVIELMKNKMHLTEEGLDRIKKIKNGMNKGRK
jgi:hypothetical protein